LRKAVQPDVFRDVVVVTPRHEMNEAAGDVIPRVRHRLYNLALMKYVGDRLLRKSMIGLFKGGRWIGAQTWTRSFAICISAMPLAPHPGQSIHIITWRHRACRPPVLRFYL